MTGILVLEDERVNAVLITRLAEKLRQPIFYASNGAEALDILYNQKPDIGLIVTDHDMPYVSGSSFLCQVKNDPELSKYYDTPAIGIGDFPEDKLGLVKVCYPKPWEPSLILKSMQQYHLQVLGMTSHQIPLEDRLPAEPIYEMGLCASFG